MAVESFETLGRLNRFIELKEAERAAMLMFVGSDNSGNRDFQRTLGAIETAREIKNVLEADIDPSEEVVDGRIWRRPLSGKGSSWLHTGSDAEFKRFQTEDLGLSARKASKVIVEKLVRGTRAQLWRELETFLKPHQPHQ